MVETTSKTKPSASSQGKSASESPAPAWDISTFPVSNKLITLVRKLNCFDVSPHALYTLSVVLSNLLS